MVIYYLALMLHFLAVSLNICFLIFAVKKKKYFGVNTFPLRSLQPEHQTFLQTLQKSLKNSHSIRGRPRALRKVNIKRKEEFCSHKHSSLENVFSLRM